MVNFAINEDLNDKELNLIFNKWKIQFLKMPTILN